MRARARGRNKRAGECEGKSERRDCTERIEGIKARGVGSREESQ